MRKSTAAVASLLLGSSLLISWRIGLPDYEQSENASPLPSSAPQESPSQSAAPSPEAPAEPVVRVIDSDEIDYKYGVVQVSVTMTDSTMTSISMLQGEASNGRAAAYEMLIDATLQVQGTSYGNVTGATYTTEAFKSAIENVIAKAKLP